MRTAGWKITFFFSFMYIIFLIGEIVPCENIVHNNNNNNNNNHARDDTWRPIVKFHVFRAYAANVGGHVRGYDGGQIGILFVIRGG